MGDSGMRGASAIQDTRFKDKEALSIKATKFPPHFDQKVDLRKINISVLRPWIATRVTELIRVEDDVVVEYVYGMLEDRDKPIPDPRKMQVNLVGFMDKYSAAAFVNELWTLLLSAQETVGGVPASFIEAKKKELEAKQLAGDAPDPSRRDYGRRDEKPFLPPAGSGADISRGHDRSFRGGGDRRGGGPGGNYGRDRRGGGDFERTRDSGYGARGGGGPPPPSRDREGYRGGDREREGDRYRDRERDREYNRDSGRGWDRDRERGGDRDRDRGGYRRRSPSSRRRSPSPPPRRRESSPARRRSPSPPPRRREPSVTPPRRGREEEEDTPPRRRKGDDDTPPRRREDDTPPRRKREDTPASTPPRKIGGDDTPPRRKERDDTPPRRREETPEERAPREREEKKEKKEKKLEGPLAKSKWA